MAVKCAVRTKVKRVYEYIQFCGIHAKLGSIVAHSYRGHANSLPRRATPVETGCPQVVLPYEAGKHFYKPSSLRIIRFLLEVSNTSGLVTVCRRLLCGPIFFHPVTALALGYCSVTFANDKTY